MRVGILEAETLTPAVVSEFGSYGDMFENMLHSAEFPQLSDWNYNRYAVEQGQLPKSIKECDAYMVTGSRYSAFEAIAWIEALKEFIRELERLKIPCIGICFGHQLIAQSLGGKVERSVNGWGLGVKEFRVYESRNWMEPPRRSLKLLVSHQDQVVELPPKAQLIAGNEYCPNAMYQLGDTILSLQPHPEFNKNYIKYLIEKRRGIIEEQTRTCALNSLQLSTDSRIAGNWLIQFMLRFA